jgi:aldehyde dehydrogenase (NAD+)/phenylacetaldehyde dehydrogenase
MWKIAPALALGNAVVLKPASVTPLTSLLFAELLAEAGLPPGAFQVLTGPGAVIGKAMAEHPGIDKISFTGETETGKSILRAAAGTVKRVSMELGGKSPNVVFADADLDSAAKGAINAIFYGKGELCSAGSRLLVEESIHDALMERVVERAKKMAPGDPLDPKTRLGSLVSEKQRENVARYVESGRKEGAKLVAGGNAASVNGRGAFFEATVFDAVTPSMTIAREEIFGPVLATLTFQNEEEAVAVGNSTIYGLAAAVWSRDIKKALRTARALKAGTVWINAYNLYDPGLPFGGYKESGFGRERGRHALEEYTQIKSIWVDLT